MAAPNKAGTPKKAKNPLLTGADLGFPFENLCGSAILMPIAHEETTSLLEDVNKPPEIVQQEFTPNPNTSPSITTTTTTTSVASKPLFTLFKEAFTGEMFESFASQPPNPNPPPPIQNNPVPLYNPESKPPSMFNPNPSSLFKPLSESTISEQKPLEAVPLYSPESIPSKPPSMYNPQALLFKPLAQNMGDQKPLESVPSYNPESMQSKPPSIYNPQATSIFNPAENNPNQQPPLEALYQNPNLPPNLFKPIQNTNPVSIFNPIGENNNPISDSVQFYNPQNIQPTLFRPIQSNTPDSNFNMTPSKDSNQNQAPMEPVALYATQNTTPNIFKPVQNTTTIFSPTVENNESFQTPYVPISDINESYLSYQSTPLKSNENVAPVSMYNPSTESVNQSFDNVPFYNPQINQRNLFYPPPISTIENNNPPPPPAPSTTPSRVQNLFNPSSSSPVSLYNPTSQIDYVEPTPTVEPVPMFEPSAPSSTQNLYNPSENTPLSLYNPVIDSNLPNVATQFSSSQLNQNSSFVPYFTPITESNSRPQSQNSINSRSPSVNSLNIQSINLNTSENKNSRPNSVNSFTSNMTGSSQPPNFTPIKEANIPACSYFSQTSEPSNSRPESSNSFTSFNQTQNQASFFDNSPTTQNVVSSDSKPPCGPIMFNPSIFNQRKPSNPQILSPLAQATTQIFTPTSDSRPESAQSMNQNQYIPATENAYDQNNSIKEGHNLNSPSVKLFDPKSFNQQPVIENSSEHPPPSIPFFANQQTSASFFDQPQISRSSTENTTPTSNVNFFNPALEPTKIESPKLPVDTITSSEASPVSPPPTAFQNLPPPPSVKNTSQYFGSNQASYFTPKSEQSPINFFIPSQESTFINQTQNNAYFPSPIENNPIPSSVPFYNPNNQYSPINLPPVTSTPPLQTNLVQNIPEIPLYNPNPYEEKIEHKILNQTVEPIPLFSTIDDNDKKSSPPPASIPVSVSQINPKHSHHNLNPYSKSTVSTPHVATLNQVPPSLFTPSVGPSVFTPESVPTLYTPVSNQHVQSEQEPVNSNSTASFAPPPPPKTVNTMSGSGNSYRLGGNSRPQYAPPPGLGSSVSAIASLAASMAMSTPLPVPGTQPHYDPLPFMPATMPSIVASAPGAASASELFTPQSTPADVGSATYRPVYHHWFFKREIEGRPVWIPFSMADSLELEKAHNGDDKDVVIATDGGRYDVHVTSRRREPVYWHQPANEVRRCSWFYRGSLDSRSCPYEENFAARLEEEYRSAFLANRWPRRVEMSYGEAIVFNGPVSMLHLPPTSGSIMEDWGSIQDQNTKPRIVRRGCDEFDIDEGEPNKPDHLLFLVHGIGSACDLKFRSVVEVVDDFRSMALTLVRSHFRQAGEEGRVGRVEVLPVSWHGALHGEETGIDKQLQGITLKSIPKLRHFTNDTLLDILFYTSPVYCQTIISQVGHELNRLQQVFMRRNPEFSGGISLGGHSLGSLILFDLLYHQRPSHHKPKQQSPEPETVMFPAGEDGEEELDEFGEAMPPPRPRHLQRRESCRVDYMMGPAGTGQCSISYPQLHFSPMAFFALGSPIAMFVTVRGIESLGQDFCLPSCPSFFNIFHPFDPVAYRIEALVNPELSKLRPVVIPHHKGRKRMHIELRETMARVGTDLKERLVDSVRSTWNSVYQLAMFNRGETLEQEVDKVLAQQMLANDALAEDSVLQSEVMDNSEPDTSLLGSLNGGRRVDYVLQEAPLESFNEYLFALGSHVCYWESEDTMLMMLKEIYNMLGISPDRQFDRSRESSVVRDGPRERSWSSGSKGSASASPSQNFLLLNRSSPQSGAFGTPPPAPLPPPPTVGFVRK